MTQFQFLSDEWLDATRALRDEYRGSEPEVPAAVRMNLVVTGVPFGGGVVQSHFDTSGGLPEFDAGHLVSPDLTVTLDYETARSLFTGGDPAAVMTAFLSGRMKVDGDITKLIAFQTGGQPPGSPPPAPDPRAAELLSRIQAITA